MTSVKIAVQKLLLLAVSNYHIVQGSIATGISNQLLLSIAHSAIMYASTKRSSVGWQRS